MERFKYVQPSPFLSSYVKRYWILETDEVYTMPQRIVPSGSVQLSFYQGDPVRLSANGLCSCGGVIGGQMVGYWDISLTGYLKIFTVVFQPFGARAFFRIPMSEITDQVVALRDLNDKSLCELEDRIMNTRYEEECIGFIEQFLISRLKPFKDYNYNRLYSAIELINRESVGQLSLTKISGSVCLGYKQFRRIFSEYVGTNPKSFQRIVRFQRALFILQNFPEISFTRLAYECGYYDQSHLINEFKVFSGYTPTEFMSFGLPESDYFS